MGADNGLRHPAVADIGQVSAKPEIHIMTGQIEIHDGVDELIIFLERSQSLERSGVTDVRI